LANLRSLSYAQKRLDQPDGFKLEELQITSDTFTVAGSETTATLLTAATYYLLKDPSKFELLIKEVRTSFASELDITMTSVNSLKYELAVLEEVMRLFPALPGTSARVTGSVGATICGRYVPPGTAVGVPSWAAYHSSHNFRDPDDFVPERWLGDPKYADDKRTVFQPFSYGPRNCIGRK
jgi:aspirochlorine biosynthesis cytochrome P450 monooxygenase